MKICFITKHEVDWSGSRVRVGVYLARLRKKNFEFSLTHIIPNKLSELWLGKRRRSLWLYQKIYSLWHARILKNLKILKIILQAKQFDVIFIQKVNIVPLLLSILKSRQPNLIFDFDDLCLWPPELINKKDIAIGQRWRLWRYGLEHPRILRKFSYVIAGNKYLADIAVQTKPKSKVIVIPTSIDCSLFCPNLKEKSESAPVVVGWSGTGENHLRHLKLLVRPLEVLANRYKIIFRLVGAMYSEKIKQLFHHLGPNFVSIDWVVPQQLPAEIRKFDIGVMPLENSQQAKGKCGLKALEYMACGIPVVVTPLAVNREIVQDNYNGFWASSESEWIEKLSLLIQARALRDRFALQGRKTVEENYSLNRTFSLFVDTMERFNPRRD